MGKINILDHDVASKIAAGEVIERPVSVVKELIENSIDAGCKNIIVEIEKGGKRSIKVTDDGKGMLREDVKLAFKRHATSKISMADDIFSINTLGFRGEALASIAAVSKLTAVTKTSEDVIGTLCKISGGVIKEFGEVATTNGCQIEVRDLFYNTPARLKFLSNDTYEVSRITDLVMRFATGNIDTSFRLIVDGKELFYASGNGDYKEVIAKIHGVDLAREIISIEKVFEKGRIWGYISKPNFNRGNRTGQTFFVNHRFVKDTGLTFCLERAYKTMLPIRRFPISIIFIDIENSQIDVNVHPSKMKIKFRNENLVHKALFHAVNDNLRKNTLIPNETFDTPHAHKPKTIDTQAQLKFDYDPSDNMSGPIDDSEMYKKPTVVKESNKELPIIQDQNSFDAFRNLNVKSQSETLAGRESENLEFSTHKFGFTRILGQLFHTYIIAEGKEKFYLIDQHAAHERILYELYSDKYAKTSDSQNLITPYVLHLSAQEVLLIENYKKTITRMGFDFSVFGTDSVLIRSVPYILNKPADPLTLRDIIDAINSNDYNEYPEKKRLIISMACHAAIKAGDVLSSMEIKDLLKQLEKTVNPYTCPHGRPTIISMTLYELEKKFKRT